MTAAVPNPRHPGLNQFNRSPEPHDWTQEEDLQLKHWRLTHKLTLDQITAVMQPLAANQIRARLQELGLYRSKDGDNILPRVRPKKWREPTLDPLPSLQMPLPEWKPDQS